MSAYIPDPDAKYIDANGLRFAYLEWGEGPLVLLVHGFPDTARTWDAVGPALAESGYRVVAPFTRGIAPTAIPDDRVYDSDSLGRDLLALIPALGAESAVLVGHDWGASAVYSAAGLSEGQVSALATLAIPHPASIKPRLDLIWGARHFFTFRLPGAERRFAANNLAGIRIMYERWSPAHSWPEEEFASAKNSYAAPGSLRAALDYYRFLTSPSAGTAVKVELPALILGGSEDGVARASDFEASVKRFRGPVEVQMLPGGHFLHREHPQPVIDALRTFLAAQA